MLNDWIERHFLLPEVDLPDLRTARPEEAAEALRARWGLGQKPISGIISLLEAQGVRVFSLSEDWHEMDAFSVWNGERPFIFLNTKKSVEKGVMDAAHELGHLVLHRHEDRGRNVEAEATAFAGCFMMPRASILATARRYPTLSAILREKERWGVSAVAYVVRLSRVGLISEWHYRQMMKRLSRSGFRSGEPGGRRLREGSQLLNAVLEQLRLEGRPRRFLADQMDVYPEDIDALMFGLTLTAVPGGRRGPGASSESRAKDQAAVLRLVE